MNKRRRRPWWVAPLWVAVILVVALEVLRFVPSGKVVLAPGITGNLRKMVDVKNGKQPGPGKMLMVAINIGTASEYQYLMGRFHPTEAFQSQQQVLGPLNMNQYIQYNDDLMNQSQLAAKVAGERLAGVNAHIETLPGALVMGILKTGTAHGKLKPGDIITQIGPYPVKGYQKLRQVMRNFKVGEIVNITVQRGGQQKVIPVKTTHVQHDPAPAIGILVGPVTKPIIPRQVQIKAGQIGGPSAGMMFALEIYDQITGKDVAHGHIVAGTGEILPSGRVLQIGGVQQKVVTVYRAGARVFVVPKANYPAAEAMAKKMGYHMKIFPVTTIHQALDDIESATS